MTIEQANAELSRLCSVPVDKRTKSDLENIHALEQIIDQLTMYGDE